MDGYGGGGGGERALLASELAQVLSMVRELEARMDDQDLLQPAAARELCGQLASSVDRSIQIARSCGGCPGITANAREEDDAALLQSNSSKRRKGTGTTPCVRRQLRVASVKDMAPLDDGLSWRKYGQKDILGAKYPRAYFRCTHRHSQGCLATKHVQRADADPLLYHVVYHGAHACAQAAHPAAEQLRRELHRHLGHAAGQEQQTQTSPSALQPDAEDQAGGKLDHSVAAACAYGFADAEPAPGDFAGCFSPTGVEWQLSCGGHAAAAGMELEPHAHFDELFANAAEPFQWDLCG